MLSWWSSLRAISILNTIAQWSVVGLGAIVLVLTWRQSSLQDQARADEKRTSDKALTEANQKIAELQPKPLKDRLLAYLNHLDPQILQVARATKERVFQPRLMTNAQIADLQRFCAEDAKGQFIRQIPTRNVILGGDGMQGGIRFSITDELLK